MKTNTNTVEQLFYDAVLDKRVEEIRNLIRDNPTLDVNWMNPYCQCTSLHQACFLGEVEIVTILLNHPNIDVNAKDGIDRTPLELASCSRIGKKTRKIMLKDRRVDRSSKKNKERMRFVFWF